MHNKTNYAFYYTIVLISILIFAENIRRLTDKADIPVKYECINDKIVTTDAYPSIDSGSIIISIDGKKIQSVFQLEFILDNKKTGESIPIEISKSGTNTIQFLTLIPYYDNLFFIIFSVVIAVMFMTMAIFAIIKKPHTSQIKILFWLLVAFAIATASSPGKFITGNDYPAIFMRALHALSFSLGIAIYLHFSLVFPEKVKYAKLLKNLSYGIFILFGLFLSYLVIKSMYSLNIELIALLETSWDILYVMLLASIVTGAFTFYFKIKKLPGTAEKKKIYWVLWGVTIGVFPYLILFVIPTLLNIKLLIPEEYSLLPLVLIPVSFTISVVKYRIFDIEIIIKRSIVYSLLTGFLIVLYFAIIFVLSSFINQYSEKADRLISLIAAFTIAILLYPAGTRIQKFVNKIFYREKYSFEKAVSSFTSAINESSTLTQVGKTILQEILKLIPAEKIGLILTNEDTSRVKFLAHINMVNEEKNVLALRVKKIASEFNKPFALDDTVQHGVEIDSSLSQTFKRWKLSLAIPLKLQTDDVLGGIVLGNKLSGLKYSSRDIELLCVLGSEAAIALKRLQLQEELIAKELENKELEELNSLKSFFVSSVTHDLKTPLTSIRMFAEMLKNMDDYPKNTRNEYLSVIEGESERLSQLIDNVLTYSKIESGVMNYSFRCYDLNNLVNEVICLMDYQLKIMKVKLNTALSKESLLINTDKNAFQSLLINLLSNAIKYSGDNKQIEVETCISDKFAVVSVHDNGIGIPEFDLKNIFDPYFRSDNQGLNRTNGTGLGLAIVRQIMDSHNGKIEVSSTLDKGSTFKLFFPLTEH